MSQDKLLIALIPILAILLGVALSQVFVPLGF
jgi:hypothetical protein